MLDHLGIQVADLSASKAFYDAVLAPLGAKRMMEFPGVAGYGITKPDFWLGPVTVDVVQREVHVAFSAPDRATVIAFHEAGLAHGAEVLHAPRVFPEYHPDYFGAFLRDPDGNNVEAVCHLPAP